MHSTAQRPCNAAHVANGGGGFVSSFAALRCCAYKHLDEARDRAGKVCDDLLTHAGGGFRVVRAIRPDRPFNPVAPPTKEGTAMRIAIILTALLSGTTAHAHPGHLAELAGHGHWLGAAALGAAIAIGLWSGLRARKDRAVDETEKEAAQEDPQEA